MKNFFLLLIISSQFSIFNSFSQSPGWQWAKAMGGAGLDVGVSIVIDPVTGDVYTTGDFEGTADFDPGAGVFNLTSLGYEDIFISKLDSLGNFVWAKAMGGGGASDNGNSISINPSGGGDVYTTGSFTGTADFDPGPGIFNLTSAGSNDIFVSKLSSSGNFIWAKQIGGTGYDNSYSIVIDIAGGGDVYTTGEFIGTVDFDPGVGTFNLTSASTLTTDIFIYKSDSSGNFVWAKRMGGTNHEVGDCIAIDPVTGDVYTTGNFGGTADFDPGGGVFNLTALVSMDIFISKLNNSGNFVWAKAISGTGNDYSHFIAIDPLGSGAVYTTGTFQGTADFDPGVGVLNLISNGNSDMFISKLDASGNLVWAKTFGGAGTIGIDEGRSITLDPSSGDVYTIGGFVGIVDFDPGPGVFNLTGTGMFILKLNASGNFVWAKSVGGISGESIALSASRHVHVEGRFGMSSISFGSDTLINAGVNNTADIYIARLDTGMVTGINENENFGNGISIFPNPFSNSTTISFSLLQAQKVSLKIFDVSGRLVSIPTYVGTDKVFEVGENEITWDNIDVNAGIYFLQIETASYSGNQKLIVTK